LARAAPRTGVLAGPLRGPRGQFVTVPPLRVGVSSPSLLFLPYAMIVVAVWAWLSRPALRRHRRLVVAACLFLPLTLVTPLVNKPSGTGTLLLTRGTAFAADRPVIVIAVAVTLAGLLARGGWRSPARRLLTGRLGVAGAPAGGVFWFQVGGVGPRVV